MRDLNVLSCFDGMSGAQIALDRLGIEVDTYYSSEVDKFSMAVAQHHFPNTIQLGDITKWREWDIDFSTIDLLVAGFSCQPWSVAGKKLGLDDPRGQLSLVLFNLFEHYKKENPSGYFLFENVKMKKSNLEFFDDLFGVERIHINSALISAQNRQRVYWTNIQNIEQPEDKHIYLKDIIEDGVVDRDKSLVLLTTYGGVVRRRYEVKSMHQIVYSDKEHFKGGNLWTEDVPNVVALTEQRTEEAKRIRREHRAKTGEDFSPRRGKELVPRTDGKANCLTTTPTKESTVCIQTGVADIKGHDQIKRTYSVEGKSPTLTSQSGGNHEPKITTSETTWRKLTPTECERLQTIEDDWTLVPHPVYKNKMMSKTQRYKMLGNGFTIDVICHILENMRL